MPDPDEPLDGPSPVDRALPEPPADTDVEVDPRLVAYEERLAEQRASAIEAGRRKGGAAGAAMAGAMLAVRDVLEGPKKDDAPVTVEASGDPHDLERDGFGLSVDGVDVSSRRSSANHRSSVGGAAADGDRQPARCR
jgi:hypothetical protein